MSLTLPSMPARPSLVPAPDRHPADEGYETESAHPFRIRAPDRKRGKGAPCAPPQAPAHRGNPWGENVPAKDYFHPSLI